MATNPEKSENKNPQEDQSSNSEKRRFRSLNIDGTKYKTYLNSKFKERVKWGNPHKGNVFSEFPGTVVKVDVEKGDKVQKGDRLYIYEAMKMKNRAYAPIEGEVKDVRIKENDVIRKGELLFVIE
jgi:biotin carboxyl carrier protein